MAAAHSVEAATGRPPYTETIRTIWLAAHRRPYAAKPLIIPNSSFLIPNSSFDNSQFTEELNSYKSGIKTAWQPLQSARQPLLIPDF